MDDRGSFPEGSKREFLLFAATSRPALGPTQPPIQWVPGALSLGKKRPGWEAGHSPPLVVSMLRMLIVIPPLPHTSLRRGI
jgi:hypothetical protein